MAGLSARAAQIKRNGRLVRPRVAPNPLGRNGRRRAGPQQAAARGARRFSKPARSLRGRPHPRPSEPRLTPSAHNPFPRAPSCAAQGLFGSALGCSATYPPFHPLPAPADRELFTPLRLREPDAWPSARPIGIAPSGRVRLAAGAPDFAPLPARAFRGLRPGQAVEVQWKRTLSSPHFGWWFALVHEVSAQPPAEQSRGAGAGGGADGGASGDTGGDTVVLCFPQYGAPPEGEAALAGFGRIHRARATSLHGGLAGGLRIVSEGELAQWVDCLASARLNFEYELGPPQPPPQPLPPLPLPPAPAKPRAQPSALGSAAFAVWHYAGGRPKAAGKALAGRPALPEARLRAVASWQLASIRAAFCHGYPLHAPLSERVRAAACRRGERAHLDVGDLVLPGPPAALAPPRRHGVGEGAAAQPRHMVASLGGKVGL